MLFMQKGGEIMKGYSIIATSDGSAMRVFDSCN